MASWRARSEEASLRWRLVATKDLDDLVPLVDKRAAHLVANLMDAELHAENVTLSEGDLTFR